MTRAKLVGRSSRRRTNRSRSTAQPVSNARPLRRWARQPAPDPDPDSEPEHEEEEERGRTGPIAVCSTGAALAAARALDRAGVLVAGIGRRARVVGPSVHALSIRVVRVVRV